jgi:hypothetical protein
MFTTLREEKLDIITLQINEIVALEEQEKMLILYGNGAMNIKEVERTCMELPIH